MEITVFIIVAVESFLFSVCDLELLVNIESSAYTLWLHLHDLLADLWLVNEVSSCSVLGEIGTQMVFDTRCSVV